MRVDLESVFVLHTRNFTDSRVLAELFCPTFGRISCVARSSKKGGRFGFLRPFQPLLASWQGKSDLKTLVATEANGPAIALSGTGLYCGMYLNELLLRVLAVADPHPEIFHGYHRALLELTATADIEPVLRGFELDLLTALGYGIPMDVDTQTGEAIAPEQNYTYVAANGFRLVDDLHQDHSQQRTPAENARRGIFNGELITAIDQRQFLTPNVRTAAKYLCRLALAPLLGDKPLRSRELFAPVSNR